jgi:hypothetical protein
MIASIGGVIKISYLTLMGEVILTVNENFTY